MYYNKLPIIIVVKSLKLEKQVESSFVLFSYISEAVSIIPGYTSIVYSCYTCKTFSVSCSLQMF